METILFLLRPASILIERISSEGKCAGPRRAIQGRLASAGKTDGSEKNNPWTFPSQPSLPRKSALREALRPFVQFFDVSADRFSVGTSKVAAKSFYHRDDGLDAFTFFNEADVFLEGFLRGTNDSLGLGLSGGEFFGTIFYSQTSSSDTTFPSAS